MSTAIRHTRQELLRQQEAVFNSIPGMNALRHAAPESVPELEAKDPDAAFALMILNGESITGVRFKYDYDLESYLLKHMWD